MIGVFDSGSGGLTILAALRERLPERDFLYLGDHACAPYGGRSGEEVHALTQAAVERLLAAGCRLVVIACAVAVGRLDHRIVERQRHRRRADGLSAGRAGKDDIHHRIAAQTLGRALPEHPLDGIDHIALAAAVGADDARLGLVEAKLGGVGKGFESGDGDFG